MLSNWLAFIQEFLSKFSIFDTIVEAEENLFNLQMRNNEHFTTFIVRFEREAYKTGWNYNTLQFALRHALPQWIKDVLHLTPKQTTYNGYKALITQVDQHYWEDRSKNMVPWTPWNASGNTNWQARATNSIQSSIPTNSTNPASHFLPGQRTTSTNRLPGQCLPAQLNAANLYETLEPLDTNPNDPDNIPDSANDQEALCVNRIWDSTWINMPKETQEKQWKEGMCILCGFSWLHSTNPCINWPSLTLRLDRDNPTDSRLVPFNVSPSSKNSKTTIDHPQTPLQLHFRSTWSFIINVQLNDSSKVFPTLVNSGASGTFISNQLGLQHNDLDKLLKLQLFDGSPAMTRITQYHDNTLTLDNDLQFQAQLLVTQLPSPTPIMLRLLWLQDVNPNIDWKNLTMQFPSSKTPMSSTPVPVPPEQPRVPQPLMTTLTKKEMPLHLSHPQSHYDGCLLTYPGINTKAHDSSTTTLTSNSVDSGNLNIKIIGTIPFACLLQDGTPTFQLQIMPALPEEHLHTGTTAPESKMDAKELPPHHSYDHKIDLEEGTSPLFGKIYNMSEIELQALKKYLDNMLGKGFICLSISAASTPVLFAKKKNRSL
ncbi:hypothetical protein E4T56_gene11986 [Termitomyces sp. T112]|nr:hypothetical protein E4T56_gene11986 [Termitomyces sp. T112]